MVRITFVLSCAAAFGQVQALDEQTKAWNRGDIKAFVETYEDSSAITFLGRELSRGRDGVLARYLKTYDTREKMGTLRFEIIESRGLGADHHLILGKFFLTRNAAGGGDATGKFTLILRKTAKGWKIVHDHTSS
jgi:ketosteroid isomerase-like protein